MFSTVSGGYIITPNDKIPDFGANPTITSIANGNWSNPSTWSAGRVPTTGDIVDISPATTVTYDADSTVAINTIEVQAGGELTFATNVTTEVVVSNFVVLEGGTLQVGTAAKPVAANVTATIEFADVPLNTTLDPQQFGNGLIGLGTVTMHGATLSDSFVALAAEAHAGDTTLQLAQAVTGWQAGDLLVLPDTRQVDSRSSSFVSERETVTLASISADGKTLTLAAALQFDHLGAHDASGTLKLLPHVGDLTRNVNVKSQNPTGNRGYVMFTDRANVDVEYAAFHGVGRQKFAAIDNTTFDSNGNVTHVGTNEMDRNPVTFRYLNGPTTPQADGYQYTFLGNSVYCPMDTTPDEMWGITIDGSDYGLIQDNLVYAWAGAGIMTQTGAEVGNMIKHNFVLWIAGNGVRESGGFDPIGSVSTAFAGSGFWFRGPDNYVEDNVTADDQTMPGQGDAYAYGYIFYGEQLGTVTIPAAQGDDPTLSGQGEAIDMNSIPLLGFSGNEVYGSMNGATVWFIAWHGFTADGSSAGTIQNLTAWHINNWGIFGYPTSNLTIDGYTDLGDPAAIASGTPYGMWFSDYGAEGLTINDANIQDMAVGIETPWYTNGVANIENTYLDAATDVIVHTMGNSTPAPLPAKSIVLTNDQFAAPTGMPLQAIVMEYASNPTGDYFNYIQNDTTLVYNYNDVAGDDFQVYYSEQAANFITLQSQSISIGSPVAGLTNQQNWDQYGIAIAGAIAPTSATTRAGIVNGLVMPIPAANAAPDAPGNLVAIPGNGQVQLFWSPSAGAISYNIYRGTTSGGEVLVASGVSGTPVTISSIKGVPVGPFSQSASGSGLSWTDASIAANRNYYEVTAVNSAGESPKSNETGETPVEIYITDVYAAVLGRAPGSSELQLWDQQLTAGLSHAAFVNIVDHSAEYYGTVIRADYSKYLGRNADAGGLGYWTGQMQAGVTDEWLEALFVASPEYYAHSGGTDLDWVDHMYQDILGRSPDAAGQAAWVAYLANGGSRLVAAYGFAASAERESQHIQNDYQQYLGRPADPSGLAYWLNAFEQGVTNEDLITGFVASDEYYNSHS